jgi:hypothetical protein
MGIMNYEFGINCGVEEIVDGFWRAKAWGRHAEGIEKAWRWLVDVIEKRRRGTVGTGWSGIGKGMVKG